MLPVKWCLLLPPAGLAGLPCEAATSLGRGTACTGGGWSKWCSTTRHCLSMCVRGRAGGRARVRECELPCDTLWESNPLVMQDLWLQQGRCGDGRWLGWWQVAAACMVCLHACRARMKCPRLPLDAAYPHVQALCAAWACAPRLPASLHARVRVCACACVSCVCV